MTLTCATTRLPRVRGEGKENRLLPRNAGARLGTMRCRTPIVAFTKEISVGFSVGLQMATGRRGRMLRA